MGTKIVPEVSKKNKYWISRHRYYELKHFCLQYPTWKHNRAAIDFLNRHELDASVFSKKSIKISSVEKTAMARLYYTERIEMVENAAKKTDVVLAPYILKAVTQGLSYVNLKAKLDIPCARDVYYKAYRRFFWLLSGARK